MEKLNVCHHNVLEKDITSFRHSEKFSNPWGTKLRCLDCEWAVCVWAALVVGTTLNPLIGGWGPLPEKPGCHKTRSVRPAALTTAGPTRSTARCMFQVFSITSQRGKGGGAGWGGQARRVAITSIWSAHHFSQTSLRSRILTWFDLLTSSLYLLGLFGGFFTMQRSYTLNLLHFL